MFHRSRMRDRLDPLIWLHLAELYHATGMKSDMEDAINQFFNSFRGNIARLQIFIEDMEKNKRVPGVILPNRSALLVLLAEGCRDRSKIYEGLADFSHNKKK